jgi:hypothetical protein
VNAISEPDDPDVGINDEDTIVAVGTAECRRMCQAAPALSIDCHCDLQRAWHRNQWNFRHEGLLAGAASFDQLRREAQLIEHV